MERKKRENKWATRDVRQEEEERRDNVTMASAEFISSVLEWQIY